MNGIGLVRNILCYKDKLHIKEKVIIIILSVILTLKFNNLGFIGLLPLISMVLYICFINIKNVVKFKLLIIFTFCMWLVYDLYINSYFSAFFYFVNIMANFVSIFQLRKKVNS